MEQRRGRPVDPVAAVVCRAVAMVMLDTSHKFFHASTSSLSIGEEELAWFIMLGQCAVCVGLPCSSFPSFNMSSQGFCFSHMDRGKHDMISDMNIVLRILMKNTYTKENICITCWLKYNDSHDLNIIRSWFVLYEPLLLLLHLYSPNPTYSPAPTTAIRCCGEGGNIP
jgi:hypothetical protein